MSSLMAVASSDQTGPPRAQAAAQEIAKMMRMAGFDCTCDPAIDIVIWEKLAFNAALNSICAIAGLTVGKLGATDAGVILARQIVGELCAVARKQHIGVDEAAIWHNVQESFDKHGKHKPSMLQDIELG
jgi:2-dehydropantoate 2-reductase